jgi:hypothetical protein
VGVEGSACEEGEGGGTKTRSTVDWRTRFAGHNCQRGELGGEEVGRYRIGPNCAGRRLVFCRRGGRP